MSILVYILQVSVCLAIFYSFYFFVLRKETLFESNRTYILLSLLSSFALPLIKIYVDTAMSEPNVITGPVYVGSYVQEITYEWSAQPVSPFPWDTLLKGVYALGVALLSIRLFRAVREIHHIRRSGKQINVLGYPCIISEKVKTPFSFFRSIYLPVDHRFNENELREVVSHELAHVQGKHTLDIILVEVACIFLWPSPLIYLYRKAIRDIHEYMADAAVVKDTPWEHYADLLLHQQQGQLQNVLSNQLIFSQLKKRILMMNKERSGSLARFKYLGVVPILLVALVLFSFREKTMDEQSLSINEVGNTDSDSVIHFSVAADQKIYFGLKRLTEEQFSQVLDSTKASNPGAIILIDIEPSHEVGWPGRLAELGKNLNLDLKFNVVFSDLGLKQEETDTFPAHSEKNTISEERQPFEYVEQMPNFPGCEDMKDETERFKCKSERLYQFIGDHLRYPEEDRKKGIQGMGIVQFVVLPDGQVSDINVRRSPSPTMADEMIRLIELMNEMPAKWNPGFHEGKAVPVRFTLPIKFVLDLPDENLPIEQETTALFPGCAQITDKAEQQLCSQQSMNKFIGQHLQYPEADQKNGIEGNTITKFIIDEHGRMSYIEVIKSPSETIKAELLRVMELMANSAGPWTPAYKEGKAVASEMILPGRFKLEDEDKGKDKTSQKVLSDVRIIQVIPNPANEEISIEFIAGATTIAIFDETGSQVWTEKITQVNNSMIRINVSKFKSGWYAVHLIGEGVLGTGKFSVVQ